MAAGPVRDLGGPSVARLRANLLGPFSITLGERGAGRWRRPSAKRLCELVMVSPGRRVGREAACDVLFANLGPAAAANALSRALSMAREALSLLGEEASGLLRADRGQIWVPSDLPIDVDLESHQKALRSALSMGPGSGRDEALAGALAEEGVLLEDEPYADWALRPREALELLRQRARLELARDRTRGFGRSQPEAVIEAWENCLSHDPTSEEAASALMRVYAAQGRRQMVSSTYERCRAALEELGLRTSPALEEVRRATVETAPPGPRRDGTGALPARPVPGQVTKEERRQVSVLFAELSGPVRIGQRLDPEDVREVLGPALAGMIAEVEGLGGTVTSISGAGLVALFGAPEAHEDDPERAVRAASRLLSVIRTAGHGADSGTFSVRIGIETGPAVVGPLGAWAGYGAVGEVVGAAAALQSAARAGSVLVGPVTRAATEGTFEWGPTEEVAPTPSAKPLVASYLERPKARPAVYRGHPRLAGHSPLVGRRVELAVLDKALREATSGAGSVVFVVGEPGLGKTRLVQECRKRFMAWVGAGTGRLPLWLEGRCASYASSTPYGLYQQLLSAWVGVAPEEGEEAVGPALKRAMKVVFGGEVDHFPLLANMMGLRAGTQGGDLDRLSPEGLQRATFAAVRAVVERLVAKGPTVLVLEDLHWADPTSLRLTEELAALARDGPLLVLATRRPEPDPGVSDLQRSLDADTLCPLHKIALLPLNEDSEMALAKSLMGGDGPETVIQAVCEGVEGNPLFLEERISSLVETGAIVRDGTGWHLSATAVGAEVPDVLERLIRSRVDRLRPVLRDTTTAASVLGAEFSLSALRAVTGPNGDLPAVLEELCAVGLLGEVRQVPEPVYRFRHALIQEATYRGMLRSQRRQLHARAAWGLEAASADRLREVAAVLGHHYAMAGESERAVHYLEVAGDHAVSICANDEAIASYQQALAVIDQEGTSADGPDASSGLRVKLAQTLKYTGRYADARAVLKEALHRVSPEDPLRSAGLQAELGALEIADHNYDAAMAAFDTAEALLGEHPEGEDQAVVDLWLGILVDNRANVHYWRDEPEQAAAALARARPVVEARGSLARKKNFYISLALQRARETRYRMDEDILSNARAAVTAAQQLGDEREIAWIVFCLGFFLLWQDNLTEAREQLEASLAIVQRTGDPVLRARCLCYLNVTALRRHDVDAVRSLSGEALAAAETAGYPEYVAAAKATMAWVAWREGRLEEVVPLAEGALELWGSTVVSYSWYWICLWPLIAVSLDRGRLGDAVAASRKLLVPPQQRLPDELELLVESAGRAWDKGQHAVATQELREALQLACRLGYA